MPTWFERLKKNGLQDIKLYCPIDEADRLMSGFSNTSNASVMCFFKEGYVTFFTPDWQFDPAKGSWTILYSERKCINPPQVKPRYESNLESFEKALSNIRSLAVQIECNYFADVFESAQRLLEGSDIIDDVQRMQLPKLNLQLFEAACEADVFGAMGSWNDSPPFMAHKKGLDAEYEELSDELLRNIRLAVLYAVNEW